MHTALMQAQFQHILDSAFTFGSDFLSFIVLTVLVLLFSVYFGRDRFAPLIAGLYAALAVYQAFPYTPSFIDGPLPKIILYIVLSALGFFAFSGLSYFMARAGGSFFSSLLLSIVVAGFVLAISIHILPVSDVYHFASATQALFASNQAFFWWLAAPLAALFFFGR